jgi:hypothetical protein
LALNLVAMHLGLLFITISDAPHFDYSDQTPLCVFDWPREDSPEARTRYQQG